MYYIIGDIHGYLKNLIKLYKKINELVQEEDTIIFLGDYIDRGPSSFEVIEFVLGISKRKNTVFLKGNHEDMLLKHNKNSDYYKAFILNGGNTTLRSYKKHFGASGIPEEHLKFFNNLKLFYETDDFIAVHAGFHPKLKLDEQDEKDVIWIRDIFFRSERIWEKTIIFGHTPTSALGGSKKEVYFDNCRNIIGIDTGVCYGGVLSCLRWPDKRIFQG